MIEEWWGRTFEGRGKMHLENMPGVTPQVIRQLSTIHVLELVRSEGERSVRGLMAMAEARRREAWTARAALIVSIVALVVSALGAVL